MALRERQIELVPRGRRVAGMLFGDVPSKERGSGIDIEDARPFEPGDDPRLIDLIKTAWAESIDEDADPIYRERRTEVVLRVILLVDRRPSMALFAEGDASLNGLLDKPAAVEIAGCLIAESATARRGQVGFLDYAKGQCFWRPPNAATENWKVKEKYLPKRRFGAPHDALARSFDDLSGRLRKDIPYGSMLFVFSDFAEMPSEDQWNALGRCGLDVVPVIVQDPLVEQSFAPSLIGTTVVVSDAVSGSAQVIRLSKRDVALQRAYHEKRIYAIGERFRALDLDAVLLSRDDPEHIFEQFSAWAELRRQQRR